MNNKQPFRVAFTGDFKFDSAGHSASLDEGVMGRLRAVEGLEVSMLPPDSRVLGPDEIAQFDAAVVRTGFLPANAFSGPCRLKLVARFGVGLERIDVPACTAAGVMVTTTPQGVGRPIASGELAFVLALAHRLPERGQQVRSGAWAAGRQEMGTGLTGRVLASIGFGNIAQELFRLARPFGMIHLAHTRTPRAEVAEHLGVRLVGLGELLEAADFLCVNCPLNENTKNLLGRAEFGRMKSTAFLVNAARGAIVDEAALAEALRAGHIAGAALDVFTEEPLPADNPLLSLDNVIATPHSIGWTDECRRLTTEGVVSSVIDTMRGHIPVSLTNPAALRHYRLENMAE